ncbi:MAG: TRAP transporter small permease subunit, partial [Sagittula sp.]
MTRNIDDAIAQTDLEIADQDPLAHAEERDLPMSDYTVVDHASHITGIAISSFYLVAALATLYEVFSRYVLNHPTFWAFETVMTTVAAAWMLSAGYVTLKKRHIAITVIHGLTTRRQKWWLDLFAMLVGIFALYMLLT